MRLHKALADGKADRGKIDSDWKDGVWLGIRGRTGERIIGTPEGVVKAWSVKRRPEMGYYGGQRSEGDTRKAKARTRRPEDTGGNRATKKD